MSKKGKEKKKKQWNKTKQNKTKLRSNEIKFFTGFSVTGLFTHAQTGLLVLVTLRVSAHFVL